MGNKLSNKSQSQFQLFFKDNSTKNTDTLIISYLDIKDVMNMSLMNKYLNLLINNEDIWKDRKEFHLEYKYKPNIYTYKEYFKMLYSLEINNMENLIDGNDDWKKLHDLLKLCQWTKCYIKDDKDYFFKIKFYDKNYEKVIALNVDQFCNFCYNIDIIKSSTEKLSIKLDANIIKQLLRYKKALGEHIREIELSNYAKMLKELKKNIELSNHAKLSGE